MITKNFKDLKLHDLVFIPILGILLFTFLYNGFAFLLADDATQLRLLNFMSKNELTEITSFANISLIMSGLTALLSGLLILFGTIRGEFLPNRKNDFFKWGVLSAITSTVLYGLPVRVISNHGLSATIFYYAVVLYLFLWLLEKRNNNTSRAFNNLKFLPAYLLIFYTMGLPGYQKFFNATQVLDGYNMMFKDTILVLPFGGSIDPMIYFLGFMEILPPILLSISLVRTEFLFGKKKTFLKWALLTTSLTFVFLCVGLTILLNYPGATNLVLYSTLTVLLYFYVRDSSKKIQPKVNSVN